jgi:hypothetical protein
MWSILLAVAALLVAIGAALYSRASALAAKRSAVAAEAVDRRERTPLLRLIIDDPIDAPGDKAIYRVRNEGPQDLGQVTVYRPKPPDGITYRIAVTGGTGDWADDEIDLGPLALTGEARFTLSCGGREDLPEFLVRIECSSGVDTWTISRALPSPRPVRDPLGPAPNEARAAIEAARAAFDEIVAHGGRDALFFDNENADVGRTLRDNAGRLGDPALKASIQRIADAWDKAFALAAPHQYVYDLNEVLRSNPDPEEMRRRGEQSEVAHQGQGECAAALSRLNALESGS